MFVGIYLLNDIIEDANHHTMPRQIPADQRAQVTMVTYNVIDPGFTVYGCLHLHGQTGANRSYAKFRTGKFCPRTAFTICKNQFHLPENDCEGLKLVSKMALKSGTRISAWNTTVRKNRTALFRCSVAPGNFRWNDPKRRAPFTFQPDFLETFVNDRLFTSSDFTWLSTSKCGKSRIKNSSLVSPKHPKVLPLENVQCSVV